MNRALTNWNKHELWVVSTVKGIKKPKKKTHGKQNLFIRKKNDLIRVKCFNELQKSITKTVHSSPPSSIYLHPPPRSSIYLHPSHFNLRPAPSNSTQVISVFPQLSATPSTIFEPKYRTQLCNFPNFRPKYPKLSILTENWVTWYLGGADSKSRLRFLKLQPQNPFVGIFGPKIQNCPSCPDLDFWNFDPKIHFLCKFGPKNSKLSILSENWYTWYLKDADSYSNISFLNFKS